VSFPHRRESRKTQKYWIIAEVYPALDRG